MQDNNMIEEGLSLRQILFLIKKNLILIIVLVGLFGLAGAVYTEFFKETTYSTTATGLIEADISNVGNSESSAYAYSVNLTNTFKVFAVSDPVINDAYEELKVKYPSISKGTIKGAVSFGTSTASMIVTLTARTNERQMSLDIANTVLRCAQARANSLDNNGEPNFVILNNKLKIVEEAKDVGASKGGTKILVIAMAIGLVLAFAIILIRYLVNDTYTSKTEFERTYGLEVLASIPDRVLGGKNGTKKAQRH